MADNMEMKYEPTERNGGSLSFQPERFEEATGWVSAQEFAQLRHHMGNDGTLLENMTAVALGGRDGVYVHNEVTIELHQGYLFATWDNGEEYQTSPAEFVDHVGRQHPAAYEAARNQISEERGIFQNEDDEQLTENDFFRTDTAAYYLVDNYVNGGAFAAPEPIAEMLVKGEGEHKTEFCSYKVEGGDLHWSNKSGQDCSANAAECLDVMRRRYRDVVAEAEAKFGKEADQIEQKPQGIDLVAETAKFEARTASRSIADEQTETLHR